MNPVLRSARAPALIALLAAAPAAAQSSSAHGLSFVAALGYEAGSPGRSLVGSMRAAGMGDTRPERCAANICQPPIEYPFVGGEGVNITVMMGGRYRFRAPVSVEALITNGIRGYVEGYERTEREHLVATYVPFMLVSTAGLHLGPVRVGAGPAFGRTRWTAVQNSATTENSDVSALGFAADVSVLFNFRNVRVGFRVQDRRLPEKLIPNPALLPIRASYRGTVFALSIVL